MEVSMKKELLNGVGIPYDKPIEELKELLFSPNMKNFSLACEALSYSDSEEAYELLKSFINHKDKYRRLYVLKTIFRTPYSAELIPCLESSIVSDDLMFVKAALDVIAEHKIKVSEDILRNTISKHLNKLGLELYSLTVLENNSKNYRYLTEIFSESKDCLKKEIICDFLQEMYLPKKADELFELFKNDKFAQIRLEALKLGKEFGFDISQFLTDTDGHVRKFASRPDINLSFLSEYASRFTVDISDDLESATICNPFGNENIYVYYMSDDVYDPFIVRFSYHHVHLPDIESVKRLIDRIINGELFVIEFFKDGRDSFGGEITREELDTLSYASLKEKWGASVYPNADEFRIRGWLRDSGVDYTFSDINHQVVIVKK